MELKQIKQIIELMKRSDLTEFAVEEEGFKLKIRRGYNGQPTFTTSHLSNRSSALDETTNPENTVGTDAAPQPSVPKDEPGVSYIKSPMVGTFYRGASPDSKAFSDVGMKVVENTAVCIIEAMKIMNEIQAETRGTILEILVENGQPVEYGQRLFKVRTG